MGKLSRSQQEEQWKNPSLPRPAAYKQSLKNQYPIEEVLPDLTNFTLIFQP